MGDGHRLYANAMPFYTSDMSICPWIHYLWESWKSSPTLLCLVPFPAQPVTCDSMGPWKWRSYKMVPKFTRGALVRAVLWCRQPWANSRTPIRDQGESQNRERNQLDHTFSGPGSIARTPTCFSSWKAAWPTHLFSKDELPSPCVQ
jgi:hypothetical protein